MALLENYNTGDTTYHSVTEDSKDGQTFSRSATGLISYTVTHVKILSNRIGSPGTFKAVIQGVDSNGLPDGNDLASGTIDGDTMNEHPEQWNTITFDSPVTLDPDTTYAIVLSTPDEPADTDVVQIKTDGSSPTYANGKFAWYSAGTGYTWIFASGPERDLMFEIYGADFIFTPPSPGSDGKNNMVTLKRLVAAANSKIWYEDI